MYFPPLDRRWILGLLKVQTFKRLTTFGHNVVVSIFFKGKELTILIGYNSVAELRHYLMHIAEIFKFFGIVEFAND